jgi:hypothetical protein
MNRYPYIRKEYSIAECAYLAGIVDGEGSIYIGAFSSNPKTNTPHYQTNIEVSNTDKGLIEWLVNTFGARMGTYTPAQLPSNSRKTVYRWTATGERVTHLCEIMMPYLIIKKRQAEIMLKMRETYNHTGAYTGHQGLPKVSSEILEIRKALETEMRSLHCRNYHN